MELVKILPSRETLKDLLNGVLMFCYLVGGMYFLHRQIKAKGYAEGLAAGKLAGKSAEVAEMMSL